MSRITRFEDLVAWQKARLLAAAIYDVTRTGSFVRDFGFTGQLQRSAVSIMSNIAEGYERGSRAEFHHFLTISKASCAEVRSLLYLAHDIGYLDQAAFDLLFQSAEEVSRIVGGLRMKIGTSRIQSAPPSP
ncbi:MAG: four helix bundle protein [Thermomicrobiales bacterium]